MTPKIEDIRTRLREAVAAKDIKRITELLEGLHPADIAEILDKLEEDEILYVIRLLPEEKSADIITELDEDIQEELLEKLSPSEITELVEELETDEAADLLAELSPEQKQEVITSIEDAEHAKDIIDLLRYDEDTAGGLMGKELVKVNENWNVLRAVVEMRRQAENLPRVHTIYVVDDEGKLKGRLSLKRLLTTSTKSSVRDVYNDNIHFARVTDHAREVANLMKKYNLFVLPVIDEGGHLVGQITLDDVLEYVQEEAEKDFQMAVGLTDDVEPDDTIRNMMKARLPWLIVALLGGFLSVVVLNGFSEALSKYATLFFFTPLIAATAGNVGVQSSAIVVQALARGSFEGSVFKRLLKEITLSFLNGLVLSILLLLVGKLFLGHILSGFDLKMAVTVAVSLIVVIINASLVGTFVPLILHKYGIDPAVATGPFITTSNDIVGLFIFFSIAKLMLGF
ncbi:MAG: magnesium transporter [Chlorobi bacterium]|nr:magnesium transporter [Chlorobiota bacterium]